MFGVISVFFLHNIVLWYLRSQNRKNIRLSSNNDRLLLIFFVLTALLGAQIGDYFGYMEDLSDVYKVSESYTWDDFHDYHMEPQYYILYRYLGGSYFLWRFIVFGLQFFILFSFAKKTGYHEWLFYLIFAMVYLKGSIVGRSNWGLIWFFCCILYYLISNKKLYLLLSIVCIFSHRSLLILPALIPLLFLKLNKKIFC